MQVDREVRNFADANNEMDSFAKYIEPLLSHAFRCLTGRELRIEALRYCRELADVLADDEDAIVQ